MPEYTLSKSLQGKNSRGQDEMPFFKLDKPLIRIFEFGNPDNLFFFVERARSDLFFSIIKSKNGCLDQKLLNVEFRAKNCAPPCIKICFLV